MNKNLVYRPNYFNRLPFFLAIKYTLLQLAKKVVEPELKFSFAATGEDVIISRLTKYKADGFFLDVGSNHPIIGSLTFLLYLKGWTGINIDGNETLIDLAKKVRKKDTSITALISNKQQAVKYTRFKNHKLNSIDPDIVKSWNKSLISTVEERTTQTLTEILKSIYPNGKKINLLSIDVEKHDLEALTSLDLNLFPVELIVIEMHDYEVGQQHPIALYLESKGYQFSYYSGNNGFFQLGDHE